MTRKRKINLLAIFVLVFAIVLTSAILSFGNLNGLNADAYISGSVPDSIGSLTLSNYATRSDGLVFDSSVLQKLYGKLTGKSTDTYSNALNAISTNNTSVTSIMGTITQNHSMNYSDLGDIVVEFGGYKWNVVFLTTDTNAAGMASTVNTGIGNAGDLIATLWMCENQSPSVWSWGTASTGTVATTGNNISPFNYSKSYIRVDTLNNGGLSGSTSYNTGATSSNTVNSSSRANNKYAKFTMSNSALTGSATNKNSSLVDYLAAPRQVNYQKTENWVWSFNSNGGGWAGYMFPNEAWGTGNDGINGPNESLINTTSNTGGWYPYSSTQNVKTQMGYYDWQYDYLWLPSFTETGYQNDGSSQYNGDISCGASLWGIPNNNAILMSSETSWLRSGHVNASSAHYLTAGGGYYFCGTSASYAVRPALHLNLTKAQENVSINDPGTSPGREYNGSIQNLDSSIETWFTADYQNKVDVKYYASDGTTIATPQNAGTYKVGFTPKSGRTWSNGDTKEKTIDFVITKKQLDFPEFSNALQTYNGGNDIDFEIRTYDNDAISITLPTAFNGIVSYNNFDAIASVGEVGKYYLLVNLKNSTNYEFKDGAPSDGHLAFEVEKASIDAEIFDSGGSHGLSGAKGSALNVILNVNQIDYAHKIHSGNSVKAYVRAHRLDDNVNDRTISEEITLDSSSTRVPVTLDLSKLTEGGRYKLLLITSDDSSLDNESYEFNMDIAETTLNVLSASFRTGITWILYSATGGGAASPTGFRQEAELNAHPVTYSGAPLVYDGKLYTFQPTPPTGYTVISTNTTGAGFAPNDDVIGIYANANYVTTVTLREDSTGNTDEYSIQWSIEKAKFDLSSVRWENDGKIQYNPSGMFATLDPATIPTGLTPSYTTNQAHSISETGTANVSFSMVGEYLANYILPISSDSSTYTFTQSGSLTDFEWSKAWTVVKAVIPVSFDPNGTYTDKNGVTFTAPILADNTYSDQIEYRFYETDSNGNPLDPSVYLLANQIEVSDSVLKYYKVKPAVKSNVADRYELENENYSNHFSLGSYSEAVEIDLANATLTFNGKAQNVVVNVILGGISANQFDIVYYDRGGVTPLTSAPTNVGLYTVHIKIKSGVNGYYLSGSNVTGDTAIIDYEITKRIIDNSTWVTSHNPPSLQLSFADVQQVQYEYEDMNGNTLTFNQLVPGNTYKVRARIKDMNNCEFATADSSGDLFNTDWVEFTVSENEQLYDPLDPNNPFYPEDPDNPNNGGNNGGDNGDGNIGDKIKDFFDNLIEQNFPLWQICTIAAGGLLTLIFMIKAIQYGNRRKKAKGEAKKLNAKTYAALLPVFATDVVLAGLSNKIWSIIAFAMVGVTVLMFLIAIITRRSWKKAELAKEQAIEDSEQRRIDADRQEREAEKQERREFQERMVQVGSSGGAFNADGTNFEEFLRRHDEEMEARHREEMARRDEEQAKRDEAMKLMLANLMGRQQGVDGDMPYASMDDTDLLVQKVIAGLLPAVQQMMPEPTAYLAAPSQETEELKDLIAQQSAKIDDLQNQLADMSHNVLDAEIIPDNSEEIRALKEEHNARIDEQNAQIEVQNAQIAELQNRIDELMQGRVEAELLPDQSEEIKALTEQIEQLKSQIANSDGVTVVDNSEELRALAEAHSAEIKALSDEHSAEMNAQNAKLAQQNAEMQAMSAEMLAMRSQLEALSSMSVDELDDEDFDDEEEWDSILDEDDDDFVEAIIIDEGGKERKVYPNFRMRLKQSSDKNREWYAVIKNLFCSQKGVTYRVYKRVEKIRYQGQVIAVIGIAKRSIKLWLALKPYEYDARRYHHKDVSDKPRFVDVPMYVRVSSDRALDRSQELILALFQELNMEARKRYNDRPIQELIFTLKHNRLLTNKQNKQLLCEVMHVHDCDVLDDETAEKCIEAKNVEFIDDSNIETVKLDDIDAKFQDGNRVTLDRLKKVGLVSEDCTGFTVTADKRLTKPLIIVANDFTLTAVKLIALTGGRAIKLQTV